MGTLASFFAQEEEPETSLSKIFEEEPVPLSVFVEDKRYLGNPPLSPKQFEAVKHIERVYMPSLYPQMAEEFGGYWEEDVRQTNLITLQWGKGSGKDHICRVASLRVAYMLLCLKSPQRYFEMPDQDSIHLLNIASNSGQANRAFFKPMTEAVKHSPWFRDKAEVKQGVIEYDKHIEAVSGHSEAEGQEGLNIMLGVADEIDAFKAKDEMIGQGKKAREASTSAESILDMLKTSASTRFPASYKRVAISFPRYVGSTIQRLTFEAKKDNEEMGVKSREYVSGPWATWDVNPRVKSKEDFADDYRKDPVAAAAKYECSPSRATDAFFRNMDIFKVAAGERMTQPLSIDYKTTDITSSVTGKTVRGWEPVFRFASDFKPIQGARYALHGDLAIKGDRAGIAMSHVEKWVDQNDTVTLEDGSVQVRSTTVPKIKTDFVVAFEADISETPVREIQIRWARMLCFELIKMGFVVDRFTFDGFQSSDTMQILVNHGILSERVSADINDNVYKTLKDVASDGRLDMPYEQLLMNELESLSRFGNKVDHPPGGSKDLADAFACSIVGAIAAGGEEDPDGEQVAVGGSFFNIGPALESPFGTDEEGYMLGDMGAMPIGMPNTMKGAGFYGG
jgi:hypothetical protein